MSSPLTAPPALPGPMDAPNVGAYRGGVDSIDLRPRLGEGWRARASELTKLKRWSWAGIATPEVYVGFAIVDAGLAANGFCFAIDMKSGELIADKTALGLPGMARLTDRPGEGLSAKLTAPGARMRLEHKAGSKSFEVEIHMGDVHIDATLDGSAAPDPLAVLMKVKNGELNFTQKTALLATSGVLRVGRRMWPLADGFAGLDFTHGLFARVTAWRWAFACGKAADGTPIAFNLTDGIGEDASAENAAWAGTSLASVGGAKFEFDVTHLLSPWRISTEDGAVDLQFTPRGMHREDRDYIVLQSHFGQVAGVYSGSLRDAEGRTLTVENLAGVAEDQRVLW